MKINRVLLIMENIIFPVKNWGQYKYFDKEEFTCKCGCGINNISDQFINKLNIARKYAEIIDPKCCKFYINSGCRCKKYNKVIGGHEKSRHIATNKIISDAADIKVVNDHHRSVILTALIIAGFKHIGFATNYIHVDNKNKYGYWIY